MTHVCLECGSALPDTPAGNSGTKRIFCSPDHRRTFNNRRAMRGAELYDFFMSGRFQRKEFPSAITTMAQMASGWRADDIRERDGRQSWGDISKSPR